MERSISPIPLSICLKERSRKCLSGGVPAGSGWDGSAVDERSGAPNGLAFSPDGKRLYIDDTERREIRVL